MSKAYQEAIRLANEKYGPKSSIYRSGYIVKKYKELGGKMSTGTHLKQWFEEDWVQVVPYLNGQKVECGGKRVSKSPGKACRPLHRITKKTPITISELLAIHPKKSIIKAAKLKEKSPNKRLMWKTLSFQK